jgi:galactose-1-phosphate uridylyltransferase
MDETNRNTPSELINRDFELTAKGQAPPSEEELFQMLSDRISWLIEHNMEYLLSLLYRNDVAESKIHFALSPFEKDPANVALAKLVMERQKQRLATKQQYGKQDSGDVEEELRW